MNELVPILAIVQFALGVALGAMIKTSGFKLGFRASYELREDEGKGLFPEKKDPEEFALLEKQERRVTGESQ